MSFKAKLFRIIVPVSIILGGVVVMLILVLFRPAPQKEVRQNPGALVEVLSVAIEDHKVQVIGTGTVHARQETNITPQVSGTIIHIAPNFIAGGLFAKGDLLFKIEDVDYKLAVDRARSAIAQAELELAREESDARVARQEWERLSNNGSEEPNPLVLHEPQLKNARANVASAKAALKQAELDLGRTRIFAPFNCRVRSEEIDIGQYVQSGKSVATLAGTDHAEIVVPLPLEELQWLRIPRQGKKNNGSPATVRIDAGNQSYTWKGKVVRSLGEVDVRGRMARIVVSVADPYHLTNNRSNGEPDLEVGMFVDVMIHGEILHNVFSIPRSALREKETVWIVDGENKLRIRPVSVVRKERDVIVIGEGLKEGERLVLTSLSGAADGMKLRPMVHGGEA